MKRLTKATMAIIAASSLLLAGCGSGSQSGANGTSEGSGTDIEVKASDFLKADYDELKDGGTLTVPISEVTEQLNRFHADATADTTDIWHWYNPQVALYDDKGEWYANPAFVSDVKEEVKDGKTVITYTINKDAVWNDGDPITWKAFEATWKVNSGRDAENFPTGSDGGYKQIESVTKGDNDKVAVVTYEGTFPWWKMTFEELLNPKAFNPETFQKGYIGNPHPEWGAGPYKLESIDFNAGNVVFVPNEKYWGEKPKLERVTLRALDADAEMNAFKNGELDLVGIGNADRLAQVSGMQGISQYTAASKAQSLVQLNSNSDILKDKKVREAIFHAIDRPTLLNIRYQGMNYQEPPLGSLTLKPIQQGYQDNMGELGKFDVEMSKKLLDEAGWTMADGKEFREKDGKELEITIPSFSSSELSKSLYGAIQAMLKNVGINMNIDQRRPSDFQKTMANKDFDILMSGFTSSNPFGMADLGQIYMSNSELSKTGLGSPEIDALIKKAESATTSDESIKLGNEAEKEALQQAGWLPLYVGPVMVATKEGLANWGAMGFTIVPKEHIGWKN